MWNYPDDFNQVAFNARYGTGDETEAPAWMYRKMDNLRAEEKRLEAELDMYAEDETITTQLEKRLAENEAEQEDLQEEIDSYENPEH